MAVELTGVRLEEAVSRRPWTCPWEGTRTPARAARPPERAARLAATHPPRRSEAGRRHARRREAHSRSGTPAEGRGDESRHRTPTEGRARESWQGMPPERRTHRLAAEMRRCSRTAGVSAAVPCSTHRACRDRIREKDRSRQDGNQPDRPSAQVHSASSIGSVRRRGQASRRRRGHAWKHAGGGLVAREARRAQTRPLRGGRRGGTTLPWPPDRAR